MEEADGDDDDEFDNNVNTEEEADVSVRSSRKYGQHCFSSAGYSGSCRKVQYCRRTSYAYSRCPSTTLPSQDLWMEPGLLQALAQPPLQGHQEAA